MASFNKVIIMGNLTRDPELTVTTSGLSICKITVAVSRKYKEQEEVAFIDVTAFSDNAERIDKWFEKGRPILVEGRLKMDSWNDKETGAKRSKLGVILDTFQVVAQGRKVSEASSDSGDLPEHQTGDAGVEGDEDLPF